MIEIIEIDPKDKKTFKKFVDFPNKLYKGSPYYVPSMFADEMSLINPKKNVAFDECDFKYFLAYKDGEIAGRVAAILQRSANAKWQTKNMRFSRFDFINDIEVVEGLLGAVEKFAAQKGMTRVHGPFGINDLDREGMLTEGFGRRATLATLYNYDYYPELLQKCGYQKEHIWNEYSVKIPEKLPEKIERVCGIAEKHFGLRLPDEQNLNRYIKKYAGKFFDLYDEVYAGLPGTMPMTVKMRRQIIKQFKAVFNVNYVPVVLNAQGEAVAFGLAFPDITDLLMEKGGRLTLPVLIKILVRTKFRRPRGIEFALIGAKPGYDRQGAVALVIKQLHSYLVRDGIKEAESNPELQTNIKVQALWNSFECDQHKKRSTFFKELQN